MCYVRLVEPDGGCPKGKATLVNPKVGGSSIG